MPPKRKKKTTYKRKAYGRKAYTKSRRKRPVVRRNYKRKARSSPWASSQLSLFPSSEKRTLRYQQSLDINPGTGGTHTSFKGNGLFDPFQPAGGGQPRGFDQIMVFFQQYVVYRCKMTCEFAWSGAANVPCHVGIALRSGPSDQMSQPIDVLENPRRVVKLLPASQETTRTVTYSLNCKKYFGVQSLKDNLELQGTAVTDPKDLAYLNPFIFPMNPSLDPNVITVSVMMEFETVFMEPTEATASLKMPAYSDTLPPSIQVQPPPRPPSPTPSTIIDEVEYESVLVPKRR